MTSKHFQFIAATIADLNVDPIAREKAANSFANKLAATNPRFKREQFLAACGV